LLKLDRYEDCLRVFEDGGDKLKNKAALEYGYALYKHGEPEAAIDVVARLADDRGARHLEAQAVCFPAHVLSSSPPTWNSG
jgi:signal recognition particle subunit SRP72